MVVEVDWRRLGEAGAFFLRGLLRAPGARVEHRSDDETNRQACQTVWERGFHRALSISALAGPPSAAFTPSARAALWQSWGARQLGAPAAQQSNETRARRPRRL